MNQTRRLNININGIVQGLGFRPYVYHLATTLDLTGWVANSPAGVTVEIEGPPDRLQRFLDQLRASPPPHAHIKKINSTEIPCRGDPSFVIRNSSHHGSNTTLVLPDIATCPQCLSEIFDPHNRRYLYPFTNCTHCGPRYSFIERLPYDRANTTMKTFQMCPQCQAEYEDPADRRFHAQPNACPDCGPRLFLWDRLGKTIAADNEALLKTVEALDNGLIVAVKGLGGFHLLADATRADSVRLLRSRKQRGEKPFALMYPDLAAVKADCSVSPLEREILTSPQAPIVIVRRRRDAHWMPKPPQCAVAPEDPFLGVMLPYTPLHHILLHYLARPIVATSGNLADEPICTDENDALHRLTHVADLFLIHNRPIARHVDDSVVRVYAGRAVVLRRARGFVPVPLEFLPDQPAVLALGPQSKNSIALTRGNFIIGGPHIGDLGTRQSDNMLRRHAADLPTLFDVRPSFVAHDLHPDYVSTHMARESGLARVAVQHHHAHVAACMLDNDLYEPVLGVAWDGTGYGPDGTVWGGEFLLASFTSYTRIAHLRPFHLPGGEKAVREPRRSAIGMLYAVFGENLLELKHLPPLREFSGAPIKILLQALAAHINSPLTTSAGRVFDGIAALLGVRAIVSYEGQAAVRLEHLIDDSSADDSIYPFRLSSNGDGSLTVDWENTLLAILEEIAAGRSPALISRRFHNTMSEMIVSVARRYPNRRVVLTGGCFQNRYLLERTIGRLRNEGLTPVYHRGLPPNDGGIAAGQSAVAAALKRNEYVSRGTR